jgi:hypothetical protein
MEFIAIGIGGAIAIIAIGNAVGNP